MSDPAESRRLRPASSVSGTAASIALPRPAIRPPLGIDSSRALLLAFAAILCVLVVLPLAWIACYSVTDRTGALTLDNFRRLATDPAFVDPLITTLIVATSAALLCCVVAAPMGWLVARTDLPLRRTIRALVTASFVTPPFLGAIAWELLAAPNSGLLNQLYRFLSGAQNDEHLLNIYSLAGLIFVLSCYTFPYVFVLTANALERIPGDLEDASAILGGSTWHTARRVTIPLALPALVAGALIAFLQAMTLFGSPAILALPAGFHTMTTKIWSLFQYPPKPELAAAAALLVLLNPVFLPYGALFNAAFSRVATQFLSLGTFTLHNISFVFFELSSTQLALKNTFVLGVAAATIGTVLALVIAYVTTRQAVAGYQALGFLATAPVAIPGIVLGVGLFLSYTRPPFVLYGTLWILLIAFVTISLPAAYQQLQATP